MSIVDAVVLMSAQINYLYKSPFKRINVKKCANGWHRVCHRLALRVPALGTLFDCVAQNNALW